MNKPSTPEDLARDLVLRGTEALIGSLADLASLKLTTEPRKAPVAGRCILNGITGKVLVAETHILGSPDLTVGIVVTEAFALKISSSMLIMPSATELTEELLAAYDEAINVAIGVWNPAMKEAKWRWDNGVGARSIQSMDAQAAFTAMRSRGLGFIAFDVMIDGKAQPVVLYGELPYTEPVPTENIINGAPLGPATQLKVADVLTGGLARTADTPQAAVPTSMPGPLSAPPPPGQAAPMFPPPPQAARAARPPRPAEPNNHDESGHGHLEAALAFVDRTGALKAWLLEQLNNPEFVFTRTHEAPSQSAGQVIVLVDPTELREIRARKTIVMRRAQEV